MGSYKNRGKEWRANKRAQRQKMVYLEDELVGKREGDIALQIHSGGGIKIRF